MTSSRGGSCDWCGVGYVQPGRGPVGRYCSPAHRQAAHRARTPRGEMPAGLGERLDELARVVATPGVEAQAALWAVATEVVAVSGRSLPVELPDPTGPPPGVRARGRPVPWDGVPLPRPATAGGLERVYERGWEDEHGWQVTVRTVRARRPVGQPRPLWLRRHRAGEHPNWRRAYDWTDGWGVPDSDALHRLAGDLITDSLDRDRSPVAPRHRPGRLARHFAGDALWPLGDTAWVLTRAEIINWLELHGYLTPP